MFDKKKIFISNNFIIVIIILTNFFIYFPSVFFEFVWDDLVHLEVFRERLKSYINLFEFFKGPNVVGQPHYYRPLMLVSYGLDYLLFRENPVGYHLTSLILHISNVILIFIITDFILKNKIIGLISAVLFSVHPVHSEAIVWISARADLLCSFFSLLSLLFFVKFNFKNGTIYLILTLIFFILAILTKEIALLLIFCFLIYDICFTKAFKKNSFFYLLTFLLIIIFLVIRTKILTVPFGDSYPISYKIATIPLIFMKYLELFFAPFDLRILYYNPRIQTTPNFLSFLGWFIIGEYLGIVYYFYKKNRKLSFFLMFYLLFLLPVLGIVTFIRVSLVGDRYLYLPSYGLVVFCSYFIFCFYKKFEEKKLIRYLYGIFLLSILISLSVLSYNRSKDWSSQLIFLTKMQKDMPMYMPVYLYLGNYYFEKKDYDKSILYFELAKEHSNLEDIHIVHYNLGVVYSYLCDFEKAEENFYISLSYKNDYIKSHYMLGYLYFDYKHYDRCLEILENGLIYAKDNPDFYNIAAVCAYMIGENEKAIYYIKRAIEIDPNNEEYRKNMDLIISRIK